MEKSKGKTKMATLKAELSMYKEGLVNNIIIKAASALEYLAIKYF